MPKTVSQKIARGFELVGYLLFTLLTFILIKTEGDSWILAVNLYIGMLAAGFFLRARGKISGGWTCFLWFGNIIFYLAPGIGLILMSIIPLLWAFGSNMLSFLASILTLFMILAVILLGILGSVVGLLYEVVEIETNRPKPF